MPSSRAAIAASILKVEPGGFAERVARLNNGLSGLLFSSDQISFDVTVVKSFKLYSGALTKAKISPYDQDTIPTILRTGLSYKPWEKLWLGLETEKTLDKELRIKAGLEYRVIESLFLRTGIITNPVQNTFGIGYEIAWASADIAFTHHEILGFTPHFTFQFKFR